LNDADNLAGNRRIQGEPASLFANGDPFFRDRRARRPPKPRLSFFITKQFLTAMAAGPLGFPAQSRGAVERRHFALSIAFQRSLDFAFCALMLFQGFGAKLRITNKWMDTVSDEDLIKQIATGNRLALEALYGRHRVKLYRFLVRLAKNETAAEDILIDVFFDVWQQAGRFEARSTASTWLFAIARFKALSARRECQHLELGPDEDIIEDPSDDPEAFTQKVDKRKIIQRCLKLLSVPHREVIDLVYYHEKSIKEVGEILGIPDNTVKTRMFHARKRLSDLLVAAGVDRGWP
jgi:RNA polymerase sigma-70 factor, ECF subfamily